MKWKLRSFGFVLKTLRMSPIKIENVLEIHLEPPGNDEFDAYLKKIRPMKIVTLSINPRGLNKPWNFE